MMVLPLQRGGPTSSAATGDDRGDDDDDNATGDDRDDDASGFLGILSHSHSLKFHYQTLCKLYSQKNIFSGIQTHNFAGAVKKLPQVFPSLDHPDQQPNIVKIVIVSKRHLADHPWRVLSSVSTIISTGNCGRNINDKI